MNKLEYGFVSTIGSGEPWLNSWVDRYNSEIEKINTWINERGYCPENIINGAHNLFFAPIRVCMTRKGLKNE